MKSGFCIGLLILVSQLNAQMRIDTIQLSSVDILEKYHFEFTPAPSKTVDSLQLASESNSHLGELFEKIPGLMVRMNNPGGVSSLSFRGLSASHTKVKYNGQELNSPLSGQFDFSLLPVDFVDQVEIQAGNASLEEQAGALGGTIVLKNQIRWNRKFSANLSQEFGSFGKKATFLTIQAGTKKLQSRTKLGFHQADNNFEFENTAILPVQTNRMIQSEFNSTYLSQEIFVRPKPGQQLVVQVWYSETYRNLPPHMTRLDEPDFIASHYCENSSDLLGSYQVRWEGERKNLQWHTRMALLSASNLYTLLATNQEDEVIRSHRFSNRSDSPSAEMELSYQWNDKLKSKSKLLFGYDKALIKDEVQLTELEPDRISLSWMNQLYYQPAESFKTYFLLRSEWVDDLVKPLIPAIGLEYQPAKLPGFRGNFSVALNHHYPGLSDLYFSPGGNPDLKPESGLSSEINLYQKLANSGFEAEASAYYSEIENWILWRDTEYGFWSAENLEKVRAAGYEAGILFKKEIDSLQFSSAIHYTFSSTVYDGDNENSPLVPGHQLIYIPKNQANLYVQLEYKELHFSISQHYVGERATIQLSDAVGNYYANPLKPHFPLNLQLGFRFRGNHHALFINMKINNILNQSYQLYQYRPMPGRNASIHLKLQF